MAQRPAELTPLASAQHFFGAEIRRWRLQAGFSLAQMGREVHASADFIAKIEKARRWPTDDLVRQFDAVLHSGGVLPRLHQLAAEERKASRTARVPGPGPEELRLPVVVLVIHCFAVQPRSTEEGRASDLSAGPRETVGDDEERLGVLVDLSAARARRSRSIGAVRSI